MDFLCYHIDAEASTTQQRAALRRLYHFLGYSLHAGYRRPQFGLLDDKLKVAYKNNTFFAEYQMTFWLALSSCFRKLSNHFVIESATACRVAQVVGLHVESSPLSMTVLIANQRITLVLGGGVT